MGTLDVEVPYRAGPQDNQRCPDFSDYSKESVNISSMNGLKEKYIDLPETGDFSKAWEELSSKHGDAYIEENYDISRRVKGKREGTWPDKSPDDFTWHHNGDHKAMQLVDETVHDSFTHKDGAAASRG